MKIPSFYLKEQSPTRNFEIKNVLVKPPKWAKLFLNRQIFLRPSAKLKSNISKWNFGIVFFYNNLAQVAECLFFLQKSLHPTVVVFIDSSDGLANHFSSWSDTQAVFQIRIQIISGYELFPDTNFFRIRIIAGYKLFPDTNYFL